MILSFGRSASKDICQACVRLQTIYQINDRDLFNLRLRSLNDFLEAIGMDNVESTYDIDLEAVIQHLDQLTDDDDNHLKQTAKKYYEALKKRTRESMPNDFKFVTVSITVASIVYLSYTHPFL